MSRLLVFGDLHCDRRHLRGLVERAVEERCDALLSLGDLCYLPRDPEGRRFLRSAGVLLRQRRPRASARGRKPRRRRGARRAPSARTPAAGPGAARLPPAPPAGRNTLPAWSPALSRLRRRVSRPVASSRSRLVPGRRASSGPPCERLAGGGEIDLLFCHDPRTLEQGAQARGPFAALAAKLRPALVLYAHQHRPHVSAAGQPALVGLGSYRDGQSSAVVLDSAETGRLVRALRDRQTAAQLEAKAARPTRQQPARLGHGGARIGSRS